MQCAIDNPGISMRALSRRFNLTTVSVTDICSGRRKRLEHDDSPVPEKCKECGASVYPPCRACHIEPCIEPADPHPDQHDGLRPDDLARYLEVYGARRSNAEYAPEDEICQREQRLLDIETAADRQF